MKIETVYLIQHKDIPEYTKIGITKDLTRRIKSLQTSSPTGIHVVYSIQTTHARQIEKHLHKKYSRKNTNLEWFKLSREDIVEIIFYLEELNEKLSKKSI